MAPRAAGPASRVRRRPARRRWTDRGGWPHGPAGTAFTVDKAELVSALGLCAEVTAPFKGPDNILGWTRVTAHQDGTVQFTCTDYDVLLCVTRSARVVVEADVCLHVHVARKALGGLPAGPVHVVVHDGRTVLVAGTAMVVLAVRDPADFPALAWPEASDPVELDGKALVGLVERTLCATSRDATRPSLQGVRWTMTEGRVELAATDGHRLALASGPWSGGARPTVVLHHRAMGTFRRLLMARGRIAASFTPAAVVVQTADVKAAFLAMDEVFPNVESFVPTRTTAEVRLDTAAFTAAVRGAASAAGKTGLVRFDLSAGRLVLLSGSADTSESRHELPVVYEGETITLGLNAAYVLEALRAIGAPAVRFGLTDQYSPVRLAPADDNATMHIIMPMRI